MQRVFHAPYLCHGLPGGFRGDIQRVWLQRLNPLQRLLSVGIVDRREIADQHGEFLDLVAALIAAAN